MSLFSNVAPKHEVSLQSALRQRVPRLRVRPQIIETLYQCIGILPQLVYREADVVPAGFRTKCSVAMSFHLYGPARPEMGLHLHPLVWDSPENPRVHLKYNGGLSENVRCTFPALGLAHRLLANALDRVSDERVCDGLNPSLGSCHEATVRPHRDQARSPCHRVTTFTRHTRRPQTCGSSEASRAARYRGSDSGAGSVRSRR